MPLAMLARFKVDPESLKDPWVHDCMHSALSIRMQWIHKHSLRMSQHGCL